MGLPRFRHVIVRVCVSEVPLFQEDSDCDFGRVGREPKHCSSCVLHEKAVRLCCFRNTTVVEERVFWEPDGPRSTSQCSLAGLAS